MRYIADLHVHSHYSRATSKNLNLESLYQWAKIKGINVVGTGDFTHPAWFSELREKLEPDGNGFFILKDPPRDPAVPGIRTHDIDVRFCLTTEISSIYKYADRVRKNHNLVFAPDFETVARINHKLSSIGNLEADGRPILGLPSRDLLEIVLDTSDRAHLIPAHVWTPWFSTLGSKAGYDSIEDCFRDLSDHIFALETGLSSDPAMNGKVSRLDRFVLISNSDAHSPAKLGREANLLETMFDYDSMFEAFRTGEGFVSTLEFYPEEGKYHHDGHRKCGIFLEPGEIKKLKNNCPQCGTPLTVGVLHRVEELADRVESTKTGQGFEYIIPLPEVLGEIENVGPDTKTVRQKYQQVISAFGNEFDLLHRVPVEVIHKSAGAVLAEAIRRIRDNEVIRKPGYDGVYGEIRVFKDGEIDQIRGQLGFFGLDEYKVAKKVATPEISYQPDPGTERTEQLTEPNEEQELVLQSLEGATLVKAGPGTGKTHTLVEWIVRQVESGRAHSNDIVAVTFTNKAAEELRERLTRRIGKRAAEVTVGTFHALAWRWLREYDNRFETIHDTSGRKMILRMLFPDLKSDKMKNLNEEFTGYLELDKPVSAEVREKIHHYRQQCRQQGAIDLSDLIRTLTETLEEDAEWRQKLRNRHRVFAVDEFQDVNPVQYRMIRLLAGGQHVLAIGDPDQAIYGFRGSDVRLFFNFEKDFQAQQIALTRNYRSPKIILDAAGSLISRNRLQNGVELKTTKKTETLIRVFKAENPYKEADYILNQIARYVGGIENLTSGAHTDSPYGYAFGDIAVLYRTHAVGESLFKSFLHSGIPVHYGDGTPFLDQPPFTVIANLFRLWLKPVDYVVLCSVLEENYDWNQEQIRSLAASLSSRDKSFFADDMTGVLPDSLKRDLIDLRMILETVAKLLGSCQVYDAVKSVCDHFLSPEKLTEPDLLKMETLLELAGESEGGAEEFLEQMQLNPYTDAGRLQSNGVHLLTFHAAKGLEFRVVFISGAEESVTPLDRKGTDLEEERRLFYVAVTRAIDELQITCSKERKIYGEIQKREPSRFITEIPLDLLMDAGSAKSSSKKEPQKPESQQLGLF